VSFYGGGIAPEQDAVGRKPLLDRVPEMQNPLLLQYGSADKSIQPAEHARIIEALSAAGKRYSLEVYPGAGHGFFCDDRPSYDAGAAEQSWQRTLGFLQQHLGD
jgi:carboxymethylenebutenolidase